MSSLPFFFLASWQAKQFSLRIGATSLMKLTGPLGAWASEHRLSLAQVAVANKSNEITAIPQLLRLLELRGALVTIDAIGCQKEIARQIVTGGGNYLLAVKDNQKTLHADVVACFADTTPGVRRDTARTFEVGHGRREEREYTVLYAPAGLSTDDEWEGLRSVLRVVRRRQEGGKEPSTEVGAKNRKSGRVV